jgi:hypothetical protein
MAVYVIVFCAVMSAFICVLTYFICVSRERLWLRAKKSEELYHKAEHLYTEIHLCFSVHYDDNNMALIHDLRSDQSAINAHLSDLTILVGLYFPCLKPQLAQIGQAMREAYSSLRMAEAADENNIDLALNGLIASKDVVTDSFDRFKGAILAAGCVERIGKTSDFLLHWKRRRDARALFAGA